MAKVLCYKSTFMSVDDGSEFTVTRKLAYADENAEAEILLDTSDFNEFADYVTARIPFCYSERTLFKKRRYLRYQDCVLCRENTFKHATIRVEYTKAPDYLTYSEVSSNLTAEEFLEWLKDHEAQPR